MSEQTREILACPYCKSSLIVPRSRTRDFGCFKCKTVFARNAAIRRESRQIHVPSPRGFKSGVRS